MTKIAFLIPMTSKGKNWKYFEESYIFNYTLKSFNETKSSQYEYCFYFGIDSDDTFFNDKEIINKLTNICTSNNIKVKITHYKDLKKGHLTKMWNILYKNAYDDNYDYFYQCGDDINFFEKNWIEHCISCLKLNGDIGIAGPNNVFWNDNSRTLTQSMFSRKHMEIFGFLFPEEILNWYCDNWISEVYYPTYFFKLNNIFARNMGGEERYPIEINKTRYLNQLNISKNVLNGYLKCNINKININYFKIKGMCKMNFELLNSVVSINELCGDNDYDYEIILNDKSNNKSMDIIIQHILQIYFLSPDKMYKIIFEDGTCAIPNTFNYGTINMQTKNFERTQVYKEKYASFCVYGTNKKYTIGAVKNCFQYLREYKDIKPIFFIRNDVDKSIEDIINYAGGTVVKTLYVPDWYMRFCRFLPIESCEFLMSRDTDCRLTNREIYANNCFINSDKLFHIIRDHPHHYAEILAGMWSVKKYNIPILRFMILDFCMNSYKKENFQYDQIFLTNYVWKQINDDILLSHDCYFKFSNNNLIIDFSVERNNFEYIGEPYDENDNVDINLKNVIKNCEKNKLVSGNEFYKLCQWSFCPRYEKKFYFNLEKVVKNDFVFLNLDYYDKFIEILNTNNHDVNTKFNLITHNSDLTFDQNKYDLIEKYVNKIYAINCSAIGDKIKKIPLGFVDDKYKPHSKLDEINNLNLEKTIFVYLNFSINTNKEERQKCYDILYSQKYVTSEFNIKPEEFYKKIKMSKYIICPDGTGYDCHRIYESILCDSIPIIKKNPLEDFYKKLPVVVIESWRDITEEYLNDNYEQYYNNILNWKKNNPKWTTAKYWLN